MRHRLRLLIWTLVLLVAGPGLAACKPSRSGSDADEALRQQQAVQQRLGGRWVLVSFQPQESLEPMLAGLLAAQFGALTVTFDGQQQLEAQGVGVTATRRYEISEAQANRFKLVSYDDKGVPYETWGEFRSDSELWFDSRTPPWRGTGTLQRR
jgi:hypothetical protein